MFSSISRMFGQSPVKHSSPGPTRPVREESNSRPFPSTAPAELEEPIDGLDDSHFSEMPSQRWEYDGVDLPPLAQDHTNDDEHQPDGITDYEPTPDGVTDYVDPFSAMMPFSTQAVLDEEEDLPAYGSDAAETAEADHGEKEKGKKKSKKGKKAEEKEARKEKRKSKRKSTEQLQPVSALPTPTTSGPTSYSGPEEAVERDGQVGTEVKKAAPEDVPSNKKKRKRQPRQPTESSNVNESSRKKKRKTRKPMEDIEDDDMEDAPQDIVPESPHKSQVQQYDMQSPEVDYELALQSTLKSEPQQSQLVNVSRQLFQPIKAASPLTTSVSGDGDQNQISPSSPSVAAQRRRSMSRGSQISAFRQGFSMDSAPLPDRISEAAGSVGGASDDEHATAFPQAESPSAASQQILADAAAQPEPIFEVDYNADKTEVPNELLASGALVDNEHSAQEDFADNLPPSSQPLRDDTPSFDGTGMEVDTIARDEARDEEEPQLPIITFRDAWNDSNSAKKLTTYSRKDAARGTQAVTPSAARRRNAEATSELSNIPSSGRRSTRSTSSKRQRSKPNFFAQESSDQEADGQEADDQDADDQEDEGQAPDQASDEESAALAQRPSTEVAEPLRKRRKVKTTITPSRNPAAAKTATPKAKAEATKKTESKRVAAKATPKKAKATSDEASVGQDFATGKFTRAELDQLSRAVQKYRDEHGLTQTAMNDLIQMKGRKATGEVSKATKGLQRDLEQFNEMWSFICAAVPTRRRQKVINVARQEFHNFNARGGGWTHQEDARLEMLHEKHDGSWVLIAEELNRHPNDVRDRYRNYVICGGIEGRKRWTEEEERELVEAVITALRRMDRAPGRMQQPLESLVNWQTVSELMGRKRSRLQCMRKFKLLNVELNPNDVLRSSQPRSTVTWTLEKARKQIREMPPEDKYEFVQSILDGAAGRDENIRWTRLVDVQFRKKWSKPTLKLLWYRLKLQVPGQKKKSVRDCARWLLEQADANAPSDAKFLDGGHVDGDSEDELKVVDASRAQKSSKKRKPRSTEMVEKSDDSSEDEETWLTNNNADSPSALQQPSSPVSSRLVESTEDSLQPAPSLQPPASQQEASRDPSPVKKRRILSRGKSAKERFSVGDGDEDEAQPNTPSQLDARAIPDRLKEKKEAARQRISSGSRARSVASLQPESVQNSDVDEDMPPIRVPSSTQPSKFEGGNSGFSRNFARKTGSSVLPGEPVEITDEVMAELEASSARRSVGADEAEAVAAPVTKLRRTRRRRGDVEVAESPS